MVVQVKRAAECPIQDFRKASGSARAMSAAPGGQNPQRKNTGIPEPGRKNTGIPEPYRKYTKRLLRVSKKLWIGTLDR